VATPISVPVQRGDVLAGKYLVEEILGVGAMGVVVAALHVELDRRVALKFMKLEAITRPEGIERFLREARAAGRLRSEHTCQVHDVGRLENGAPYIVMELLDGEDLETLLKRAGPLPVGEVTRYMIEVCEAMAEAHAAGIVHRDLKPQNLFRLRKANGRAQIKVLDFGISKNLQSTDIVETAANVVIGTPAYMSPEQLASSKSVDPRTDIWSLGVIMYQLLVDRLPFTGSDLLSLGVAVMSQEPESPSTIRKDLDARLAFVISKCLMKDREHRFASAVELSHALAPFADPVVMWTPAADRARAANVSSEYDAQTAPTVLPPPPPTLPAATETTLGMAASESVPGHPRRSRHPGLLIGASVVVAAGLILGVGTYLRQRDSSSPNRPLASPTRDEATATPPPAPTKPASAPTTPAPAPAPTPPPPPALAAGHEPGPASAPKPAPASPPVKPAVTHKVHHAPKTGTSKPAGSTTKPAVSCDPPYTVNQVGKRIYKKECL